MKKCGFCGHPMFNEQIECGVCKVAKLNVRDALDKLYSECPEVVKGLYGMFTDELVEELGLKCNI